MWSNFLSQLSLITSWEKDSRTFSSKLKLFLVGTKTFFLSKWTFCQSSCEGCAWENLKKATKTKTLLHSCMIYWQSFNSIRKGPRLKMGNCNSMIKLIYILLRGTNYFNYTIYLLIISLLISLNVSQIISATKKRSKKYSGWDKGESRVKRKGE